MSSEWEEVKLGDLCTYIARGITPLYCDDGIVVLNQKCIRDNKITFENSRFTNAEKKISADKILQPFDILVNSTGVGTLGRVAQIKKVEQAMTVDSHVTIVRPINEVDKEYIGYALANKQSQIEALAQGSTGQTELSRDRLSNEIEIFIPKSKYEQHKISSILSRLDEKIELNNKINDNLEQIAQAIFKNWFIDFEPFKDGEFVESELGLMPKGWEIGYYTDIVSIMGGGTPKTMNEDYWNGTIPFFTPKDVADYYYSLKTEKNITENGLKNCNSQLYPVNTIFITARGTVGKIILAGRDMAMNQSCYAIKGKADYSQYFIHQLSIQIVNSLKHKSNGAVFNAIVTRDFNSEIIIIPPALIIEKFEKLISPFYILLLENIKENEILINCRDSLLPKLMSGEIDVSQVKT